MIPEDPHAEHYIRNPVTILREVTMVPRPVPDGPDLSPELIVTRARIGWRITRVPGLLEERRHAWRLTFRGARRYALDVIRRRGGTGLILFDSYGRR